jgi:carbon-monoxide dehydrogenase medium subunit
MIPVGFEYRRAATVDEALEWMDELGDEAKFLAGGHSLVPLMKLRLAAPEVLVDVSRLAELSFIRVKDGSLRVGALTRHAELAVSPVVADALPLLGHAASRVGDAQVRHRGTLGGSLAHGDPAADLPAVVAALDGVMVVRGPSGEREIPAVDFFVDLFETALEPEELITEVRFPLPESKGWSFQKFTVRAIDWAIVGVAVQGDAVGLVNMGSIPVRARNVEAALADGASIADAARLAADGLQPPEDLHAAPEYRSHLARVLVRRGLEESRQRGRVAGL